jgi:hypothetical protein
MPTGDGCLAMRTLHVTPTDSAGGSLIQALRDAGRDDEVLPFRDDLSCGPIASDDAAARAEWWSDHYDRPEVDENLQSFWRGVTEFEGRLVVWFARHAARELAFFLALTDRLGERSFYLIDVTGRRLPFRRLDGSAAMGQPAQAVSIVQSQALQSLLGTEQPITAEEQQKGREAWRRLRRDNAPFRIVTEAGLASAPIDYFDAALLEQATVEWQKIARVVHYAIGYNSEPFFQVGDLMLQARVAALVGEGKLMAEGNPSDMASRIRLPG